MIFALIPNSTLDFKSLKSKSKLFAQILGETQVILHNASIADRSRMQRVGDLKTLSLSEYLAKASLQTQII